MRYYVAANLAITAEFGCFRTAPPHNHDRHITADRA